MEPEIKQLKLEGVAPKTPPTSDSEEEMDVDQIRDHRKVFIENKTRFKDQSMTVAKFKTKPTQFLFSNMNFYLVLLIYTDCRSLKIYDTLLLFVLNYIFSGESEKRQESSEGVC